jgi:hypothetical protein
MAEDSIQSTPSLQLGEGQDTMISKTEKSIANSDQPSFWIRYYMYLLPP